MEKLTIYHNPRCSKSRETLALLNKIGLEPVVIEYLKHPLREEQLKFLREHIALTDLVRVQEKAFIERGLSLEDEEGVLKAMLEEPKLMQRPIVVYKNKAAVGRPPEHVLGILNV